MEEMKIQNRITDTFWMNYRKLVRREMIPYQWKVLNDEGEIRIEPERNDPGIPAEKSHALENFRIAAGIHEGHHYGWVFQDSDVYKWLEAAAYALAEEMDEELKEKADRVVDLIAEAQEEDGYLGTYFTIEEPERKFKSLQNSHELYCAGHFMEAAAAYYQATSNAKVLETAEKLADCIERALGPEGSFGYDGHEEVEIGLMKLYHLTGKERYLNLARHFLLIRGTDQDFFGEQKKTDPGKKPLIRGMDQLPRSYFQAHLPVLQQSSAEGHAVRLVYLLTAMADAAAASRDEALLNSCRKIWDNITKKRMYITGGIGSTVHGEAFTFDYDLPNDTMYCETCASVGLVFLARQMLRSDARGEYGDVMERALYNTVLSGTALDGKHFFYVNPLEVNPASYKYDPGKSHVKPVRPEWLGCACCPPNLARLLASVDQYIYSVNGSTCLAVLYMKSETRISGPEGEVWIRQETDYPKSGEIAFSVRKTGDFDFQLGLRIPAWTDQAELRVNGQLSSGKAQDGFVYLRIPEGETEILLSLSIRPILWRADPRVRADIGKAALARGPIVYCLEERDNGKDLHLVSLDREPDFEEKEEEGLLGRIISISAKGKRIQIPENAGDLYSPVESGTLEKKPVRLHFIPYYTWANRGSNEMTVYVRTE